LGNIDISNHIKSMCPTYYPALNGVDIVINQAQFSQRSTYPIIKLDVSLSEDPSQIAASLVVKTAPESSENIEGLTEYENMSVLKKLFTSLPSHRFENRALGFINPLEYNHKLNVLVSEFVPHRRLSEKIFIACSGFGDSNILESFSKEIYAAGKWLRFFHQIKSDTENNLGSTDYYKRTEFYIEHAYNSNLNIPAICNAEELLNCYKEKISKLDLPLGRYHGDFGLQNIGIGNDGKIYVFDLQRNYDECIYHDITYFLVTLETLNPFPKHCSFNRKKALALGQEFLMGYRNDCSANSEWSDLLFHIYYLQSLLERVRKQCINRKIGKRDAISNLILKKYLYFIFEKKIQRELNTIERLLSG